MNLFFTAMKENATLRNLNLNGNGIEAESAPLAGWLLRVPTLQVLSIG
jgi:hypothetical protein